MNIKDYKYHKNSIAILVGVVMLFSCENSIQEIDKLNNSKINTDNYILGLDMIYTDSGVVKMRMKAPLAITHDDKKDPYKEFPEGIEIFFYKDRDTIVQNYLIADYAISYTQKKFSEVRGNVIVINENGDTLNTEKMYWDSHNRKIYSDELVRISQSDQVIIGENGFEADEGFSYYKILNSSGKIKIDENQE